MIQNEEKKKKPINWFSELNAVNVNDHIEQKNNLAYLSWMWAWTELKKRYPRQYSTVHESPEGLLIWKDPVGCHVKTSVTIVWFEDDEWQQYTETEYLPCMDFRNKPIPYDAVTSMDINKTIQRSLTKCIARLGLGAYIYAGEDLPEETEESKAAIKEIIDNITTELGRICKDKDQKIEVANNCIVPIIGTVNYRACKDINKLDELLNLLRSKN